MLKEKGYQPMQPTAKVSFLAVRNIVLHVYLFICMNYVCIDGKTNQLNRDLTPLADIFAGMFLSFESP